MAWPTAWGLLRPEDPAVGARMSVLAQNVWRSNPDPDAAARALVAQGADVVVLTEFTPEFLQAFRRAGSERAYPHRILRDRPDTQGMAVFSRVPVDRPVRQASLYRTEVTLRPPDAAPLHLVAVHVPAPTSSGVQGWAEEFARLTGRVEGLDGPVVVAGDFNATSGNRPFRHLADTAGLRDAQDAGGGGFGGTWSLGSAWPPLLRLDHVMVARAVQVAAFRFVPPLGSDHRGIVAELRLPPDRPAGPAAGRRNGAGVVPP
jgi:endonuclease/exonuclease/phosphatase (EEP) superfamily protein YafD